jgi:hypothetical protein
MNKELKLFFFLSLHLSANDYPKHKDYCFLIKFGLIACITFYEATFILELTWTFVYTISLYQILIKFEMWHMWIVSIFMFHLFYFMLRA